MLQLRGISGKKKITLEELSKKQGEQQSKKSDDSIIYFSPQTHGKKLSIFLAYVGYRYVSKYVRFHSPLVMKQIHPPRSDM